ncbi:MAG: hypothetical protein ACUVX8_05280 [Candidatus Zipacnadales bacterium]
MLVSAAAWPSDLSQAIQKGNHIMLLNELGLTNEQLMAISPYCEQLVAAVKTRDAERKKLITESREVLAAARKAMLEGRAPTRATQEALEALEAALKANEDTLYRAAVEALAKIQDEFYQQQNAYIDWTPPHGGQKVTRQMLLERAQREREQAALVLTTEQQLERLRTFPLEERYVYEANRIVDDFLRPLIDPQSPQYVEARNFMFEVVEQARFMQEEEWQMRRTEFAELVLRELGLLEPPKSSEKPKPYSWQDMYVLFSDFGTPDLLRDMVKARQ